MPTHGPAVTGHWRTQGEHTPFYELTRVVQLAPAARIDHTRAHSGE